MNTLILAILLLSGYVFVINSSISRYKFKRTEGWGAYFYVAMWGAWFATASWVICSVLSIFGIFRGVLNWLMVHEYFHKLMIDRLFPLTPPSGTQQTTALTFVDLKFALFGIMSIFLGLFWAKVGLPFLKRIRRGKDYKLMELESVVKNHPHELMIMTASVLKKPVLITMGSRKFYVGIILERRLDEGQSDYLSLLPLLSGYRDKDTLTTTVTTNYQTHYKDSGIIDNPSENRLKLEDFKVLVKFDEIETISYFDSEVYSKFKEKEERDILEAKTLSDTLTPP